MRASESANDKYYKIGVSVYEELSKYANSPKDIFGRYGELKRSAKSIIDFEKGVGDWISTFDKDVFEQLQLQLCMLHGPIAFQSQTNYIRFPLIEYLLQVPREITSPVSKNDINGFTSLLFEYCESGKAVILHSQNNKNIREEIQTIRCDAKRIMSHSIPYYQNICDKFGWQTYILRVECRDGCINDAVSFTELIISSITTANWEELDHMLLKTNDDDVLNNMKQPFVTRVSKTDVICFSKKLSVQQFMNYIRSLDRAEKYSIALKEVRDKKI